MRKKYLLFIFTVLLMLVGCANSRTNYKEIKLGESIDNENFELSFEKSVSTSKATFKDLEVNLKEETDKIYYIILGKFSNKGNNSIDLKNNMKMKILFDDKFEYTVNILPNDKMSNIDPLVEQEFVAYAIVPKNVLSKTTKYSYKIGYNDKFERCELDSCKNKYEIIGDVDQFGSAANVTNFETFKEYILTTASKNENFSIQKENPTYGDYVIVEDGDALQTEELDNGKTYFSIQPTFRFSYDSYSSKSRAALIVRFNNYKREKNSYYLYAKKIVISSDKGSVIVDDSSTNRILIDTFKSIHQYETDFVFSELDYDLDKIKNIVNGNDLKVTITVEKIQSGDVVLIYECSDKIKSSFIELFELNEKIQKKF